MELPFIYSLRAAVALCLFVLVGLELLQRRGAALGHVQEFMKRTYSRIGMKSRMVCCNHCVKHDLLTLTIIRLRKSWFLPDFLVTTIDIVLTFSGAETDRASTRILRLLRLFRVVRLGKLTRFVAFVRDKFESETAYTQFSALDFGRCILPAKPTRCEGRNLQ